MPQFDPSSFPSQLFWLVLTFTALYLVLWRAVLPRISSVLEQRQEKIEDDLTRAEKLKAEAEEVLAAYNKALEDARAKAQADLKATAAAMAEAAAKRNEAFAAELAARTKEAEASIAKAKAEAVANLKSVAAESAAAATARLIGVEVSEAEVGQAIQGATDQVSGQTSGSGA
ncbi:MAG: F0F1 ATP synthase subunit B' [Kiloniellales bacterium]